MAKYAPVFLRERHSVGSTLSFSDRCGCCVYGSGNKYTRRGDAQLLGYLYEGSRSDLSWFVRAILIHFRAQAFSLAQPEGNTLVLEFYAVNGAAGTTFSADCGVGGPATEV